VGSAERNLCSARKFPHPLATATSGKQLENVYYQVLCLLLPSAANFHNYIVTAWSDGRNVTQLPTVSSPSKNKNKSGPEQIYCLHNTK
jgi:hypothetical protein